MQWKDLPSAIAKLAPTIAGIVGGPLASTGIQALESVFGLSSAGTVQDRQSAIANAMLTATPQQIIDLKKADNDLKTTLINGGVKLEELQFQDRISARQMQVATKDKTPAVLAWLIVLACGSVAVVILAGWSPSIKDPTTAGLVGTVVGYLFSELKAVYSFYFGSSSGSESKNAILDKALNS